MSKKQKNNDEKSFSTYIAIAILLFLLTTMLTAQIKVVNNAEKVVKYKRLEELQESYISLKKEYEALKEHSETQQKVVDEYKSNAFSNSELLSTLTEENRLYAALSGAKDVKGEGVVVTLNDSKKSISEGYDASSLIVHDTDVLNIVNELKAAGAEAISVNDHRIIATSAIRCVGPVVSVNGNKIAPPFKIKAIGEAQYLESAINLKGGYAYTLKQVGIEVDVEREKDIVIKKYADTLKFKFATIFEEVED